MRISNNIQYLLLLSSISILIYIISNTFLDFNQLLLNEISRDISFKYASKLQEQIEKFQWINYLLIPLLLVIKTILISSSIFIGIFFFNQKLSFSKIWEISLKAEFIFLIALFVKTLWFIFFETSFTLKDFQFFYPLSALNIVGHEEIDIWFLYPLQILNLFELAYWFILGYLIAKECNIDFNKGFSIVTSSYVPALLIWVVTVMFFTLNNS